MEEIPEATVMVPVRSLSLAYSSSTVISYMAWVVLDLGLGRSIYSKAQEEEFLKFH